MNNLNLKNFWNKLREDFPGVVEEFCAWIDRYKKGIEWETVVKSGVKFHDLPLSFQKGILAKFFLEEWGVDDWDINICDNIEFAREVREMFAHQQLNIIAREAASKHDEDYQ